MIRLAIFRDALSLIRLDSGLLEFTVELLEASRKDCPSVLETQSSTCMSSGLFVSVLLNRQSCQLLLLVCF